MKLSREQDFFILTLEHTKLKQAQEVLFDGVGFCCLGVYTITSGWKPLFNNIGDMEDFNDCTNNGFEFNNGEDTKLSPILSDRLGLYGDFGETHPDLQVEAFNLGLKGIAHMNDTGLTFKEIAAILRKYPKFYFRQQ